MKSRGLQPPFGHPWRHLVLKVPSEARLTLGRGCRAWGDALEAERALRVAGGLGPLQSLFVGGGGGNKLGGELPTLVRQITGGAALHPELEWTVELRGRGGLSAQILRRWVEGGVNRISLRGRAADPAFVRTLRDSGIQTISVDLRLPRGAKDLSSWLEAGVDQITLAEVEGRGGEKALRSVHAGLLAADWRFSDFISASAPRTPEAGARTRRAIRGREPALGLGPGAVTFHGHRRHWNFDDWAPYLSMIRAGLVPVRGAETLSEREVRLERVWSALQGPRGIRVPDGARYAGLSLLRVRFEALGWILPGRTRLILTFEGGLHLDTVSVDWICALERAGGSTESLDAPNFGA